MKNLLQGQLETFNETLMRLEKGKNKYWSKAAKVSAGALATKVQKTLDKLRKLFVFEKTISTATIKSELLHCAEMYKEMKLDLQTMVKLQGQQKEKDQDKEKDNEKDDDKKSKKQRKE